MPEFRLVGSYRYVPERGEWIGIVAKHEGNELEVLCVGAEMSQEQVLVWIKETIDMMRAQQKLDVQAADMYDRAGVHNKPSAN